MAEEKPLLRPLDVRPFEREGKAFFLLRDPLELSEEVLMAPQEMGPLLSLLGGQFTASQLPQEALRRFGLRVAQSVVDQMLQALDSGLLLDNARSRQARDAKLKAYRAAPFRQPASAGGAYPSTAKSLKRHLNDFLASAPTPKNQGQDFRGLVSPHIDYHRGGGVYAQVWGAAREAVKKADLVVILGTDHFGGPQQQFTLTRQHYATPYGVLPTHQEAVTALARSVGEDAFAGELRHAQEHSVELAAVWLHHLRGGEPVATVPVLTGGFSQFLGGSTQPADTPPITAFLHTLRQITAQKNTLVVAAADLAHVGPAFDTPPLDDAAKAALKSTDEGLLHSMKTGDAAGFFRQIHAVQNQFNVCGFSPIYLTLKALEKTVGQAAGYAQCPADEDFTSVVSVCGVTLG